CTIITVDAMDYW
nr:immunoglobulin heavy chain junction region [Mus musculus]NSM06954.1 immunoglobulin heavy chain junction region [Mus musculus]NSM07675.1 immunoglobulin heavy chain junction region [Mus musculus]NSM09058.1 immunoglobulin heavy chain junction region [Mus musculus]